MVSGSIKDHHKFACPNSRRVKSALPATAIASNSSNSAMLDALSAQMVLMKLEGHRLNEQLASQSVLIAAGMQSTQPVQQVISMDDTKDQDVQVIQQQIVQQIVHHSIAQSPLNKQDLLANTSDVYFIIDVSGSMHGQKLTDAKDAVRKLVLEFDPLDRMAIITFDDSAFFKLKPRPIEQIIRQNEFDTILNTIFAQGLTALYDAVNMAIEQLRDKNKRTILNVLTDGDDNRSRITFQQLLNKLENYPNIVLNIMHVDNNGVAIKNYASLCDKRGEYKIIKDVQIIEEYIMIFRRSYVKRQ